MKKNRLNLSFSVSLFVLTTTTGIMGYSPKPPRLTVVLVVDQFAQHYFNKLSPYLKHGLKFLIDNGVVYTNAHMPHGQPGTATGHAGLGTGTCAKDHGFVSNAWCMPDGTKVACDDDLSGDADVIATDGNTYDYGKSSHMLMVDGLSDQCVLQSEPRSKFTAYSIALKSRAAIATASKLGKALWFDEQTGQFTSSKAYFDELPEWLRLFNLTHNINEQNSIVWERMYQKSPYAYNFYNINNYDRTQSKKSMLNTPLIVRDEAQEKDMYYLFEMTPQANQLIFDCAQECIKVHMSRKHKDRLLLWVCLSPLDKLVHKYGPDSLEAIDMIYHLDKQIQRFIRGVYRTIGKNEVAFALTADHGIMPIPEILFSQGLKQAKRIDRTKFIKNINRNLYRTQAIDDIALCYKGQELVLNTEKMDQFDVDTRNAILSDVKEYICAQRGIKNAWTYDELMNMHTNPNTIEDNMKNQLFPGRSGSVIIQLYPYSVIGPRFGTSHKTPYDYDTHVPLIIFHPGRFAKRYVRQRVVALQLANTLAEMMNVPKPSASMYDILPDLFDPEYK